VGGGDDSHFFVLFVCLLFICEICGVTSFGFDLRGLVRAVRYPRCARKYALNSGIGNCDDGMCG
jgi:hypothetical protein